MVVLSVCVGVGNKLSVLKLLALTQVPQWTVVCVFASICPVVPCQKGILKNHAVLVARILQVRSALL